MERLHPRIRVVWTVSALLSALVFGAIVAAVLTIPLDRPLTTAIAVGGGVGVLLLALGFAYAVLRYRAWRFELQADALYLERGVFTEVRTVMPFVRVQHVDTQRNPVERLLGLSRVVVYTAGSRGADVSIPGLTVERATDLREDLRTRASEHEGGDGV
jgi:hypothetical protein